MMNEQPPQFEPAIIRSVHIATFVSGFVACLAVALAGAFWIIAWSAFFGGSAPEYQSELTPFFVFQSGASLTFIFSFFSWIGVFVTLPATWLIIGILSVSFSAERTPSPTRKFYFVGCSATSITIFLVTLTALLHLFSESPTIWLSGIAGSALSSFLVGIPSGLITTFVYRRILCPPPHSPT